MPLTPLVLSNGPLPAWQRAHIANIARVYRPRTEARRLIQERREARAEDDGGLGMATAIPSQAWIVWDVVRRSGRAMSAVEVADGIDGSTAGRAYVHLQVLLGGGHVKRRRTAARQGTRGALWVYFIDGSCTEPARTIIVGANLHPPMDVPDKFAELNAAWPASRPPSRDAHDAGARFVNLSWDR